MKRVEEGDGRDKARLQEKVKEDSSFLPMPAPYPCKLGPGDAKCTLHFEETQFSKKRHKTKRTKWNKSHTRRTYTRRMCKFRENNGGTGKSRVLQREENKPRLEGCMGAQAQGRQHRA